MRRTAAVAVCVWLLAFILRDVARATLETLENTRPAIAPPLGWMGGHSVELPPVTTIVVLVLLCGIVLAWWRLRLPRLAASGLGLFIGGATANTTERIVFASVTDYI